MPLRKQRRVRRWLDNARINVHRLYKPLIQAALEDSKEECIYLSHYTSLFWDEYCLIRLAVVYRGRALPVEGASDRAYSVHQSHLLITVRCSSKQLSGCLLVSRLSYWQIGAKP
ncbi:hypothetical protein [Moorena sp. SIO3I6]|uniref:hypothetical protein n=1 Tax=Moorena sp. SIO3I6 TaxID=2607831 RepID=UPI0013F8A93D|nr:hypothetical protein [Moorena sp. SIO3I6]NEP28773.1 hypothetical protein [Moorena sp. SIO3I6]